MARWLRILALLLSGTTLLEMSHAASPNPTTTKEWTITLDAVPLPTTTMMPTPTPTTEALDAASTPTTSMMLTPATTPYITTAQLDAASTPTTSAMPKTTSQTCKEYFDKFECPADKMPDFEKIDCANKAECTPADQKTCCWPTLADLQCPDNWVKKNFTKSMQCQNASGCEKADVTVGCRPTCATYTTCAANYTPNANNVCATGQCNANECCHATCAAHRCPPHRPRKNLAALCYDAVNCKHAADEDHCCQKICGSFQCHQVPPDQYSVQPNVLCPNNACNHTLCCHANCASFQEKKGIKCPAKWVPKANLTHLLCANAAGCNTSVDYSKCCLPTCDTFACDTYYAKKRARIICKDGGCTRDECCEATCAGFKCLAGWTMKPSPATIMCDDHIACTDANDTKTCCDENCGGFTCPAHFSRKSSAKCNHGACDTSQCCHATCGDPKYHCPEHWILKQNADNILCKDPSSCGNEDKLACCHETCAGFQCGTEGRGYVNRPNISSSLLCPGEKGCTYANLKLCCVVPVTCATGYNCPNGYTKKFGAESMSCHTVETCSLVDRDTCCDVQTAIVSTTTTSTIHTIYINTGTVAATTFATTTYKQAQSRGVGATCLSYTCPVPYTRKPNSDSTPCKDAQACNDDDLLKCCNQAVAQAIVQAATAPTQQSQGQQKSLNANVQQPPAKKQAAATWWNQQSTSATSTTTTMDIRQKQFKVAANVGQLMSGGIKAFGAAQELMKPTTSTIPTTSIPRPALFKTASAASGSPQNVATQTSYTTLTVNKPKGATSLEVVSHQGFKVGQPIVIDPGTSQQEANQVIGFGSLLLKTPLRYDHAAGAAVMPAVGKMLKTEASSSSQSLDSSSSGSLDSFHSFSHSSDSLGSDGSSGSSLSGSLGSLASGSGSQSFDSLSGNPNSSSLSGSSNSFEKSSGSFESSGNWGGAPIIFCLCVAMLCCLIALLVTGALYFCLRKNHKRIGVQHDDHRRTPRLSRPQDAEHGVHQSLLHSPQSTAFATPMKSQHSPQYEAHHQLHHENQRHSDAKLLYPEAQRQLHHEDQRHSDTKRTFPEAPHHTDRGLNLKASPMSTASNVSPMPTVGLTPPRGLHPVGNIFASAIAPTALDLTQHSHYSPAPTALDLSQHSPYAVSPYHASLDASHHSAMSNSAMSYVLQQSMSSFLPNEASMPIATVGIDTTGDGLANMLVRGVDLNRDGVPDFLQSQVPQLDPGTMALAPDLFGHTGNRVPPMSGMPPFVGQEFPGMDYGQPSFPGSGILPGSGYMGVPSAHDVRFA